VRGAASSVSKADRSSSRGCIGSASTRPSAERSDDPPRSRLSVEEGALEQTADFSHAPESRAEQHDLRVALESAVRALPEGYRAPLILRDVEGLSTEQAAELMGLKEAAFKSRLHRARLAVRDAVDAYLGDVG
jgi:RNA polymerase sigma-70 factor (ECF subfamily)